MPVVCGQWFFIDLLGNEKPLTTMLSNIGVYNYIYITYLLLLYINYLIYIYLLFLESHLYCRCFITYIICLFYLCVYYSFYLYVDLYHVYYSYTVYYSFYLYVDLYRILFLLKQISFCFPNSLGCVTFVHMHVYFILYMHLSISFYAKAVDLCRPHSHTGEAGWYLEQPVTHGGGRMIFGTASQPLTALSHIDI